MITDNNQLYIFYNHNLTGTWKDKEFLEWCKLRYGKLDLHHILRKSVDYLIFPFEHDYHLRTVHRDRALYFKLYLEKSVAITLLYAKGKGIDVSKYQIITPEKLRELFNELVNGN